MKPTDRRSVFENCRHIAWHWRAVLRLSAARSQGEAGKSLLRTLGESHRGESYAFLVRSVKRCPCWFQRAARSAGHQGF